MIIPYINRILEFSLVLRIGKLIITPDIERAKLKEAEAVFMEREMKHLQKRFEQEKKKQHLQFVAEEGSYV